MMDELEVELLLQREKLSELKRQYAQAIYSKAHDSILDELDIEKGKVEYAIEILKQLRNR